MTRFAAPIAEQIWDMKYRFKEADGTPLDGTVEDTWRRIARALAVVEKDADHWENEFYGALEDFKFLPAGRITAGAGTARKVTLFNCFVMGTIPDSMGGIFDMLKEAALTMQQGGGIGYDFSTIRPKGALVTGVAADASGPLSFMDVWDSMCRTIMSAGSRRGAMMATM
ncbi:MAG: ribonucleoside-diphosphate reductase, adenosylcobalamin-dependent, partial [Rhodobacteraceae bacterium]|nr:ribonucleoside-diphosphate reductase, adenosylcobalamin-dependent [Paracoccaceae bacterium]